MTQFNSTDRLLAITCDNASNNGTLYHTIEDILQGQNIEWSAEAMNVSCLAHVLNLSVLALLVGLDVTDDRSGELNHPELDESSPELSPNTATNDVAHTIIEVYLHDFTYGVD